MTTTTTYRVRLHCTAATGAGPQCRRSVRTTAEHPTQAAARLATMNLALYRGWNVTDPDRARCPAHAAAPVVDTGHGAL